MEKENFTKIDAYLNNQLSPQEKAAFESAMNQDASLQKEVKVYQLERKATQILLKNNFRDKIKKSRAVSSVSWDSIMEAEEGTETQQAAKVVKIRSLRRILSLAASVLVLVLAGSVWWSNSQFSNKQLVNEGYFEAASAGNKSGGDAVNPIFQGGLQAFFVNKDYTQAIAQFSAIPTTDLDYLAAQYYLGHSQLQQKEFTAAIDAFEKILQAPSIPSFINKGEVTWNQLLAYVGSGDTGANFQQKLTDLSTNGQPPFQQKAKELQAQLGSFWRKLVL